MAKRKTGETRQLRILSLDGSDIYKRMHPISGEAGLSVRNANGEIEKDRFRGFLDESLDTDRMERIYSRYPELPDRFRIYKEYTLAVVSVSFEYSLKEYYNRGDELFIMHGYNDISRDDLTDHALVVEIDGKRTLIAIELIGDGDYEPVAEPLSDDVLPSYFGYDPIKRAYTRRKKGRKTERPSRKKKIDENIAIPSLEDTREIRLALYREGFDIDGVHYVRYKRSAGSSREGQCLFIAEPLYGDMMEWSGLGIDGGSVQDQASYQAYISLTLSSIEKKIHIPKKSILLVRDRVSRFSERAVRVSGSDDGLDAKLDSVEVKNNIWDGEALLDKSVFDENGYSDKGMMLLRGRFFKTCAFNTNLQAWFADNGITKLSQLGGHYYKGAARSPRDIKLVITDSSLKFLKFKPEGVTREEWFDQWIERVFIGKEEEMLGVVKTDEAKGPMDNLMVRTNYQLLNTLSVNEEITRELLSDSISLLRKMQRDPVYLRYYARLLVRGPGEDDSVELNADNYRERIVSWFLTHTDAFSHTEFYRLYRSDMCKSFKDRLRHGRLAVDGSYQTILGNGMEFLRAAIDEDYEPTEPLALSDGEIYTTRFEDGEELLCERSPHITMGNLLVVKNRRVDEIDKYFNLGRARAVVCVNAIKSNIQQRLNGCDYDSDTMLITNDKLLISAAKKRYAGFGVPVCDVMPSGKVSYSFTPEGLADLDIKIAENRIGEIVNLSQFLNSLYWDKISRGDASEEELSALYADICKLAVLSGMEIDKAKRIYDVNTARVIASLREYKDEYVSKNGNAIPRFFALITDNENARTSKDASLNAPMSHIYNIVGEKENRAPNIRADKYAALFSLEPEQGYDLTDSRRRDKVVSIVSVASEKIKKLHFIAKKKGRSHKALAKEEADRIFNECISEVEKRLVNDRVYDLLIRELDLGDASKKGVNCFHSLLFAMLCISNDSYLLKRLVRTDEEQLDLIHDESAAGSPEAIYLFGHPHRLCRARAERLIRKTDGKK